jgi:hypothetical protein
MNNFDLTIQRNSTFIFPIIIWVDNQMTRKDLTGFTASLKVKRKLPSGELETTSIIELTTENGRIILGGINGTIDLFISATDTATLPNVNAYYDLKLINGLIVETALSGRATIKDGVSIC